MPLILMHLPKTAGDSLRAAASSQYTPDEHLYLKGSSSRNMLKMAEGIPIEIRDRAKLVSGHGRWGIHQAFTQESQYAVVLRHPVDRIVSLYQWLTDNPRPRTDRLIRPGFEKFALGTSLADVDNGMTRLLCGHRQVAGDEMHAPVTPEDFQVAFNRLRVMSFVGIAGDLPGFIERLAEGRGWSEVPQIPHRHRSTTRLDVPTRILSKVAERNRWDMMLYEEAVTLSGA